MSLLRGKPARVWRRIRRLGLRHGEASVILMYHRIAAPKFDPFGLCVAPKVFSEQLAWLRSNRTVLSMDALVAALEAGRVPANSVALTFDDGYLDNAANAAPLLASNGCPATVFVTTNAVDSGSSFWWDDLAARVLGAQAPARFNVEVAGVRLVGEWGEPVLASRTLSEWRVGMPPPDAQCAAYLALWKQLKKAEAGAREQAFGTLQEILPMPANLDLETRGAPLDSADLKRLVQMGVQMGGHARTHVPLSGRSEQIQRDEIIGGRRELAFLTGDGEAPGFAYPHGEWDRRTRKLVREAGYSWAVTTREDAVDPRKFDVFTLPRLAVGNWDEKMLERRLASVGG